MMGLTHIAVGIASSYLLLQPNTPSELVAATVGGSIGGILADIDVKIDKRNQYALRASLDALYSEIIAISISIGAIVADCLSGGTIISTILGHKIRSIVGFGILVLLIVLGELSKHRDRTHSVLAMLLFSGALFLTEESIGIAAAVGYSSHLSVDLLNKSPIRILYPLKKRVCLNICYADRLGNELFFAVSACLASYYLFHQIAVL